jgi:hypothetical protein
MLPIAHLAVKSVNRRATDLLCQNPAVAGSIAHLFCFGKRLKYLFLPGMHARAFDGQEKKGL